MVLMNDETISRTFLSEINFDFDIAKAAVASVKYQGFRPIADAFWTNVEGAMNLLQLPHFLLSYSAMREKQTLIFLDVYLPLANRGLDYTDKTSKKRVDDEVARRLSEWKAQEGHTGELALDADKHLAGLLDMEMMQRQLRAPIQQRERPGSDTQLGDCQTNSLKGRRYPTSNPIVYHGADATGHSRLV